MGCERQNSTLRSPAQRGSILCAPARSHPGSATNGRRTCSLQNAKWLPLATVTQKIAWLTHHLIIVAVRLSFPHRSRRQ